jgi:hypothetical protein
MKQDWHECPEEDREHCVVHNDDDCLKVDDWVECPRFLEYLGREAEMRK